MSSGLHLRSVLGWGSVALILALFFMPVDLAEEEGLAAGQRGELNATAPTDRASPERLATDRKISDPQPLGIVAALTDAPGLTQSDTLLSSASEVGQTPLASTSTEAALKTPKAPGQMGTIAALPQDKAFAVPDAPRVVLADAQTQSPGLQIPADVDAEGNAPALLRAQGVLQGRPALVPPKALLPDSSGDVVAALTAAPTPHTSDEAVMLDVVRLSSSQDRPRAPALLGALSAPLDELAFLLPAKPARVAVGTSPAEPTLKTASGAAVLMRPLADERLAKLTRPGLEPAQEAAESPVVARTDTNPVTSVALQWTAPDLLERLAVPVSSPAFLATPQAPVARDAKPTKPALVSPDLIPAVTLRAGGNAQSIVQYVTGNRVNLRTAGGVSHKVVGQVNRGTQLATFETLNGWTRVETLVSGNKRSGWMSSRYLANEVPSIGNAKTSARKQPGARATRATRADVKRAERRIIRQSVAKFAGRCTCPYNRDRRGNRCGDSSEWSNPRGYSPICYASDISRRHLARHLAQRGKIYR